MGRQGRAYGVVLIIPTFQQPTKEKKLTPTTLDCNKTTKRIKVAQSTNIM